MSLRAERRFSTSSSETGSPVAVIKQWRYADVARGRTTAGHFLGEFFDAVLVLDDDDRRDRAGTIRLSSGKLPSHCCRR